MEAQRTPAASPIMLGRGEGKRATTLGLGVTYKTTDADTDGLWALMEITAPPYFRGEPAHRHARAREAVYVLDGLLLVTIGEQTMTATRGSFILIPPQMTHTLCNPTADVAVYLMWFSPAEPEAWTDVSHVTTLKDVDSHLTT